MTISMVLDEAGEPMRYVSVFSDVTALWKKDVAKRLLALVRSSDTIARVGGDEFIFLLNNPRGRREITDVANRIVTSINEPIEILGVVVQIGVSLGIATFPADGDSASDLIINADSAMYAAKSLGKNHIHFFSAESPAPPETYCAETAPRIP